MTKTFQTIKNSAPMKIIAGFLASRFFPFITAALIIACYYASLDIVAIIYIGITGTLIFLLLDDVSPILTDLLFMSVFVSYKNTPNSGRGDSNYYLQPQILAPLCIIVAILVASAVFRLVVLGVKKKFSFTPMFFGLCALSVTLIMNGVLGEKYYLLNLMFGFALSLIFLGLFAILKDNLVTDKNTFERIALNFTAFSLLLVIELIVAYFTIDGIFTDGNVDRSKLVFGWGAYTQYGAYLVMCIPCVVYLAGKYKYGFPLTLYSFVLVIASVMCFCRQAMVCTAVIYPVCLIILFIKGKNKLPNLIILAAALIASIVVAGLYQDYMFKFFETIFANIKIDGELYGSGRMELYRTALKHYKQNPIFGIGFYYMTPSGGGKIGFSLVPQMYHNTILEMMGACGTFGLIAYLVHRALTVISYFRKITLERTFIALTILSLLIVSLLDNHVFNIFPTMIYTYLISVLVKSEDRKKPVKQAVLAAA